jgi:hypothetical protein
MESFQVTRTSCFVVVEGEEPMAEERAPAEPIVEKELELDVKAGIQGDTAATEAEMSLKTEEELAPLALVQYYFLDESQRAHTLQRVTEYWKSYWRKEMETHLHCCQPPEELLVLRHLIFHLKEDFSKIKLEQAFHLAICHSDCVQICEEYYPFLNKHKNKNLHNKFI